MDPSCRLYYRINDWELVDLALDGVHVDVSIVDVHAKALMSQRFTNKYRRAVEATYSFLMLANSAVCGFEMIRGDGTKVEGHVMEKKAAKKAYETAKKQGKTAGLGEEQTKDLFTIKVGNILPSETVTINITFLIPLIDDEKRDQIRFTFPRAYGSRYGTPPTAEAVKASSTSSASQKFSINVSIQQAASIRSVSCPSSHPIELSLGRPDGVVVDSSVPNSNLASVKMLSPTRFLTQDFVLVITAVGLDAPRCFIEPSKDGETTAIGISLVPRFKVPDVEGGMEYIFMVDRSGSMDGTPIKLVRQALIVLLRGLPTKNTSFNIFSFGTHATSLWPASKDYSQKSLDAATAHVDDMDANYGGTEIAAALGLVFKSLPRKRQKPTAIFLLTDGESWDIDTCKSITSAAVGSPGPFIRVFTVGIGGEVSTDTTESIARAGDGMAIYVKDNEPMTGKLARLVRAGRTPPIKDLEVLWPAAKDSNDEFEMVEKEKGAEAPKAPRKISLFTEDDEEGDSDVGAPPKPNIKPSDVPVPSVQQGPLSIPGLFPGTRIEIYAIISTSSLQSNRLQEPIKVRGKIGGTDDIVELDIPIARSLTSQSTTTGAGLIHTLAARAVLTDREDNKHTFPPSISSKSSLLESYLEADIIRIGTKYGLTSKYTSYVAIDEEHPQQLLNSLRQSDELADIPRRRAPLPRGTRMPKTRCQVSPHSRSVPSTGYPCTGGFSTQSSGVSGISIPARARSPTPPASAPESPGDMFIPHGIPFSSPRSGSSTPSDSDSESDERSAQPARVMPTVQGVPMTGVLQYSVAPIPVAPIQVAPIPVSRPLGIETSADDGDSDGDSWEEAEEDEAYQSSGGRSVDLYGTRHIARGVAISDDESGFIRCNWAPDPVIGTYRRGSMDAGMVPEPSIQETGLTALARLQQFDGSFTSSERLFQILDVSFKLTNAFADKDAAATALALVWMRREAAEDGKDMITKAEEWLRDHAKEGMYRELIEWAEKAFA